MPGWKKQLAQAAAIMLICVTLGTAIGAFDIYFRQFGLGENTTLTQQRQAREAVAEDTAAHRWRRAGVGGGIGTLIGVGVVVAQIAENRRRQRRPERTSHQSWRP